MSCVILSDFFAIAVQLLLGVLSFSVLVLKRRLEVPRRPWGIWSRDTSKQIAGAAVGHGLNILLALHLKRYGNECVWYFFNFFVDSSLGVLLNWFLLKTAATLSSKYFHTEILVPGAYNITGRNRNLVWIVQVIEWVTIITIVKAFIFISVLLPLASPLGELGRSIFTALKGHPHLLLITVMIIVPLLMNAFQFWVQDSFLMDHSRYGSPGKSETEPFLSQNAGTLTT